MNSPSDHAMKLPFSWRVILALILCFPAVLHASSTLPTLVDAASPLVVDDQTSGLWRFDSLANDQDRDVQAREVQAREVQDLSAHNHTARLDGNLSIIDAPLQLRSFKRVVSLHDRRARFITGNTLSHTFDEAFSVEMRASMTHILHRKPLLRVGDLQLVLTLRQAGTLVITGRMKTRDGKEETFRLENNLFFKHVGRERRNMHEFHHYALTWDGKRQLRVYVDGFEAWTPLLPEEGEKLIIGGDPALEVSGFDGLLAEVRVSDSLRTFKPIRFLPTRLSEIAPEYRFDMGGQDTPVQDGCIAVTPESVFSASAEFGWLPKPIDSHDAWFTGMGFSHHNEDETRKGAWGVRTWFERDGVTVPSGASFHARLPAGTYDVRVLLGHMRLDNRVSSVKINGAVYGEHMKRRPSEEEYGSIVTVNEGYDPVRPESKTVRGVVKVEGEGLVVTLEGEAGQPVHVLGIEVFPWAAPVVQRNPGTMQLTWMGEGQPPTGFKEAAEAYARLDFKQAVQEAEKIDDLLTRCTLWAWVLGYPDSHQKWHVELTEKVRDQLLRHLDAHRGDVRAAALLRATEIFLPALLIQYDEASAKHLSNAFFGTHPLRLYDEAVQLGHQILEEEPYFGRARLICGQALYTIVDQSGGYYGPYTFGHPAGHPAKVPPIVPLQAARDAYPNSRLPAIYMGQRVPVKLDLDTPADAPRWAVLQREALTHILGIIHYWIDERQDEAGLLGGGLGDDVEALRRWNVAILFADDDKVRQGWRKLAETAWNTMQQQPYPKQMRDVEHNAEVMADTHTFYPFVEYGTDRFETVLQRSRGLYPLMAEKWTARTPDGHLMFKSLYYSRDEVRPGGSGDHDYQFRAVKPLLLYQWFTDDSEIKQIMLDWADSWRDAMLAQRDGKPAGISPVRILYPDRQFKAEGTTWYEPGYYKYPVIRPYRLLLCAYMMSGDEKYLEPIRKALTLLREADFPQFEDAGLVQQSFIYRQANEKSEAQTTFEKSLEPGSLRWALWTGRQSIGIVGGMYRLLSKDKRFDDVLQRYGPATTQFQIAMDQAQTPSEHAAAARIVEAQLDEVLGVIGYNREMFTSEVKSTDRIRFIGDDVLSDMATGQVARDVVPPLMGVTWKQTGHALGALIIKNTTEQLSGYLYSFPQEARTYGAVLWKLEPGQYELRMSAAEDFQTDGAIIHQARLEITRHRGQQVDIKLPAQQQVYFSIQRIKN